MEAVGQQSADRVDERQHPLVEGLGGIFLVCHCAASPSRRSKSSFEVGARKWAIILCGQTAPLQWTTQESGVATEAGPCGPIEPLFEPVVAPEHFAVRGDETRRTDDADLRRAGAFGLEQRLVGGALGPLKRRRRIDAACG